MSASEMERLRADVERYRGLAEENAAAALRAMSAANKRTNELEAAQSQALEALRGTRAMVASFQRAPWAHDLLAYLDAALSGSSAPQAPDSELDGLLDEMGAGLGCTPYLDGGAINRAEAALSRLRAALSMKSEQPEDAEGGSQKGSGR